jgi:hypothetical protein
VNQYCHLNLGALCEKVRAQGFEFRDFKITFSISIVAYVNKIRVLSHAEELLGNKFPHASKDISRALIDFKEVYKWIMSPLIARELGIHANLDGEFLINVNFCNRTQVASPLWEQTIIEEIQKDLDGIGIGKIAQGKRKFKQQWKQDKYGGKHNPVKSGGSKGAEQIISNISKLATPLLKEITIHKHEIARTNLNELMSVDCSMENLLLYGRYVKLSREVSQTPWNISTKKMVS